VTRWQMITTTKTRCSYQSFYKSDWQPLVTNSSDTTNCVPGYVVWVITVLTAEPVPIVAANSKSAACTLWISLGIGSERELICSIQHRKVMQPGAWRVPSIYTWFEWQNERHKSRLELHTNLTN